MAATNITTENRTFPEFVHQTKLLRSTTQTMWSVTEPTNSNVVNDRIAFISQNHFYINANNHIHCLDRQTFKPKFAPVPFSSHLKTGNGYSFFTNLKDKPLDQSAVAIDIRKDDSGAPYTQILTTDLLKIPFLKTHANTSTINNCIILANNYIAITLKNSAGMCVVMYDFANQILVTHKEFPKAYAEAIFEQYLCFAAPKQDIIVLTLDDQLTQVQQHQPVNIEEENPPITNTKTHLIVGSEAITSYKMTQEGQLEKRWDCDKLSNIPTRLITNNEFVMCISEPNDKTHQLHFLDFSTGEVITEKAAYPGKQKVAHQLLRKGFGFYVDGASFRSIYLPFPKGNSPTVPLKDIAKGELCDIVVGSNEIFYLWTKVSPTKLNYCEYRLEHAEKPYVMQHPVASRHCCQRLILFFKRLFALFLKAICCCR